jgi:hypothetical protein
LFWGTGSDRRQNGPFPEERNQKSTRKVFLGLKTTLRA